MLTRVQFLRSIAGFGVTTVGAIGLLGCKEDGTSIPDSSTTTPDAQTVDARVVLPDGSVPDAPVASCDATSATIASNHGHSVVVPAGDVAAGIAKSYTLSGGSHSHMIDVSAAMFGMLQVGTSVVVTSTSVNGHVHAVTVSCV